MAVAQPKPKAAPKAPANPTTAKGKMQMHRRSRTGWLRFITFPVIFLVIGYDKFL